MKISVPLRDAPPLAMPVNNDPHADPNRMPRFSAPVSFLGRRVFLLVVTMLSLAFAVADVAKAAECLCNFDATKDYFPVKLAPQFATKYWIEYHKSYKKLTIFDGANRVERYLYLCGSPRPAEATDENSIQIPIDSSAVTSTTYLPLIAYIGQRTSVKLVSTPETDLSACFRKMYRDGRLIADSNYNIDDDALNATNISLALTGQPVDVVFTGSFQALNNSKPSSISNVFGNHTKGVLMRETTETHHFGPLEWVEVAAALFNKEAEASSVISSIEGRYNCLKNLVRFDPPLQKKKVAWGTWGNWGWLYGSCPNYYCQVIADAGGELLIPPNNTEAGYQHVISQADVWIYPDGNFLQPTTWNPTFLSGARNDTYFPMKVVQTEQVYDFLASWDHDWFEFRFAEPDVLLMDLMQAFWGDRYIASSRSKRFIRNAFTEQAFDQSPPNPDTCVDDSAVLYTNWLEGPCAVTSDGAKTTERLCALNQGSDAMAVGVQSLVMSFGAAMVIVATLWF